MNGCKGGNGHRRGGRSDGDYRVDRDSSGVASLYENSSDVGFDPRLPCGVHMYLGGGKVLKEMHTPTALMGLAKK
jgi:hypothetical protein